MDADQLSQPENSPEAILKAYVEVGDVEEYNEANLAEIRKAWWSRYHQLNGYVIVWRLHNYTTKGGQQAHQKLHYICNPTDLNEYGCAWAVEAFENDAAMSGRIAELEQQEN